MADQQKEKIKKFLDSISMNESSGGKNTEHETMQTGIHAGDTAVGNYGLMPNTVQEMHKRMKMEGNPNYNPDIIDADSTQVQDMLKQNPQLQQQAAEYMAGMLLKKTGGDPEAAAYGWRYGHNAPADQLIEKSIDNPYVNSFDQYYNKIPAQNFTSLKNKIRGK